MTCPATHAPVGAVGLLVLLVLFSPAPARSQAPAEPPPPAATTDTIPAGNAGDAEPAARCDGAIVSSVEVMTQRPDFRARGDRWWRRVARSVGLRHHTTSAGIVRRFVSLEVGRPCTEFRRYESERILRSQPYLSSAAVRTVDDGKGGVRVLVQTVDEVPAIVGLRIRNRTLAAVRLGNENLFGRALHAEVRGERGFAYRDGFGGRLQHSQLFGRPYTIAVAGERRPAGHWTVAEAGHPFFTDLQRIAWHVGGSESHDYMGLLRRERGDDAPVPNLSVRRRGWDVGGVFRFGPPGKLGVFGGAFTGEKSAPEQRPVYFTDTGLVQAAPDVPLLQYRGIDAVRANLVGGVRALSFTTVTGFDALSGEQDLATGLQLGMIGGRAFTMLGSRDEDLIGAADLYAGKFTGRHYMALRLEGEARQALGSGRWDGVMGGGRGAWYFKQSSRFTFIGEVRGAAAWDPRLPVVLRLGERHGVGVRGFDASHQTGERLLATHLEQRLYMGPVRNRAEVGLALFADAGKLWAGDAPYGETTPVSAAVGISLLGAAPRGAQRLWRVDLAVPVRGRSGRGWEVQVSSSRPINEFWNEPDELSRARSLAGPMRVFSWP